MEQERRKKEERGKEEGRIEQERRTKQERRKNEAGKKNEKSKEGTKYNPPNVPKEAPPRKNGRRVRCASLWTRLGLETTYFDVFSVVARFVVFTLWPNKALRCSRTGDGTAATHGGICGIKYVRPYC